jgi:hypothetical protein
LYYKNIIKYQSVMKNYSIIFLMLLSLIYLENYAQTTIWSENFTYPNGTIQGSGNPPKWTRTMPTNADWFEVRTNRMEGRDLKGEAVWTTEAISISGYSMVNITIDLSEQGGQDNTDYIGVYYILDGGPETQFATNGYFANDFTSAVASQMGLVGNNLVLTIRVNNNANDEYHRFDNVLVYEPLAGDFCSNAIAINEVTDLTFSTTGATESGQNPGCGGGTNPVDIWYAYTATITGNATFDLCGSSFNTRLAIWDGCAANVLACNDNNGPACTGLQSSIEMIVTNGSVYYVQVGGSNAATGNGDLSISVIPTPPNDNCTNAIAIGEVSDFPFSTIGATTSGQNPGCGGTNPLDIWYTYTPTVNGIAHIDLCGSMFDTRLAIWDGCGGNVLLCNDNDDFCGTGSTQSYLTGTVSSGTTYYIQISGTDNITGNGLITITIDQLPSNDNCVSALPINEVSDLPFSTTNATASGLNPGCGGGQDPVDLWYAYTATATGTALFDLCGSDFVTRLAIWDACGGNVLACNNILGPACLLQSSIEYDVAIGTTYYIQVGGLNATTGDGDLSIYVYPPPANDNCANALAINEVVDLPFATVNATASGENPGCGGGQDPIDLWYAYTATVTGFASFDLCGSNFNTRLAVWNACGGSVLGCNDNFGPSCFGLQSSLELNVVSGTTYYVQVGGSNTETGTGDLTIVANAYPTNDECTNALAVGEVIDLPFTTVGASAGGDNPGCGGNQNPIDIWFAYTPTLSGIVSIDLCGSSFNTRLALWDACGGNVILCNDNDNYCGFLSQTSYISGPVIAGTTYYVQVGGNNTDAGNGDLTILFYPDPTNDDCTSALAISEVTDLPFTTIGATASSYNPGCGGGQDPVDIWYAYTASASGLAIFDLCGSNFDTRLAIWDACGGNVLACNDNNGPKCIGQQSSIELQVFATITYYVQVGGSNAETGNGDLTISLDIPGLWTGAVSTDWSVNSNWKDGNIPFTGTNVLIPANPSGGKYPETNSGQGAVCNDLVIQSGARMYIPSQNTLTVNGNLANNAGSNGLVLKSGFNGTGSLLHSTANVNATVEQYLTTERWHSVSPPISDATINVYYDVYLLEYNESDNTWDYMVEPTTTPLNTCQGYYAWVDDSWPIPSNPVSFQGQLNSVTDYPLNLAYTTGAPQAGFNLVGNPFPCALDWSTSSAWNRTNISGWMTIKDGATYCGWNPYLNQGWNGKTDGIIPSTQGFWVRRLDSSPATLTIPASGRVHDSQIFYKNTLENTYPTLRLKVENAGISDEAVVIFHPEGNTGFDGLFDLEKFTNGTTSPDIYTVVEDRNYAFNILPGDYTDWVIPVYFRAGVAAICIVEATEIVNFTGGINIYLQDIKTGTVTLLEENTVYEFDYSPLDDLHRFNLHFKDSYFGLGEAINNSISVYTSGDVIYINRPEGQTAEITVYDIAGREVFHQKLAHEILSQIKLDEETGYYVVKVQTGDQLLTEKVFIK